MSFEETSKGLYERAAWMESMEGTIKYNYKEEPDDAENYTGGAKQRFITLSAVIILSMIVVLIVGIVIHSEVLIAFSATILVFWLTFCIIFIRGLKKNKTLNDKHLDDVKLAFNAYGVVFRMCSDLRSAVFAYEWNDFESIVEYDKVLVGVKQNVAYIFPKRVFSEEEYNKFRRFSYAAIGKKCIYKNFKSE